MAAVDSIEDAIAAIRDGKFAVVVDDFDRENEGDLILSAERMTTERMAFMIRHTSGVICSPITRTRAEELRLPLMVPENEDTHHTAFTVTVDLHQRHGTTTGISAEQRAATVRALASGAMASGDFQRPGHVFPLRYQNGGVLVRGGHTEASIDLAVEAGAAPVGCLSEIANDDGTMARMDECAELARAHGLPLVSIADLRRYRMRREGLVRFIRGEHRSPGARKAAGIESGLGVEDPAGLGLLVGRTAVGTARYMFRSVHDGEGIDGEHVVAVDVPEGWGGPVAAATGKGSASGSPTSNRGCVSVLVLPREQAAPGSLAWEEATSVARRKAASRGDALVTLSLGVSEVQSHLTGDGAKAPPSAYGARAPDAVRAVLASGRPAELEESKDGAEERSSVFAAGEEVGMDRASMAAGPSAVAAQLLCAVLASSGLDQLVATGTHGSGAGTGVGASGDVDAAAGGADTVPGLAALIRAAAPPLVAPLPASGEAAGAAAGGAGASANVRLLAVPGMLVPRLWEWGVPVDACESLELAAAAGVQEGADAERGIESAADAKVEELVGSKSTSAASLSGSGAQTSV